MSLYYVQKFLFELNRDEGFQARYANDRRGALVGFDLTDEEERALIEPDIGLLFHLGVNGQILMPHLCHASARSLNLLVIVSSGLAPDSEQWSGAP